MELSVTFNIFASFKYSLFWSYDALFSRISLASPEAFSVCLGAWQQNHIQVEGVLSVCRIRHKILFLLCVSSNTHGFPFCIVSYVQAICWWLKWIFPTPIALLNSIFLDPMNHLPSLYGSYYEYLNFIMSRNECFMCPLHPADIRTLSGTSAPLSLFQLIQPTPLVRCLDPSFCYGTHQSTSQQIQPSLTSRIIQLLLTSFTNTI